MYSSNDDAFLDISVLPKDIFELVDRKFYDVVKSVAGESLVKILKMQLINSAGKLLNTPDVFAFLNFDSEETDAIKLESCFKSKTGQLVVKPGIQSSSSYLIKLLKKALRQKQESTSKENNDNYQNDITDEFLDNHPLLKSLIKWFQLNDSNGVNQSSRFLTLFIDNLINNLTQSPNNFRYSEPIKNFAVCLYVLGGKQVYEFIRLNLSGSIPNLATLGDLIKNSDTSFSEAEFRFESLNRSHLHFGFCSEDSTGVVRKVEYDSKTNSFVGFATPIDHGVPLAQFYQADTFNHLKTIYDTHEIAPLLNVHMLQAIPTENDAPCIPRPFLLSAYGVDNKTTAISILNRWMYIFQHCYENNFRIIGFSTDADRRYVSAMRLASGFFASSSDLQLDQHQNAFRIDLPKHWTWFFLRSNQLLLFFQDPIHLVTKWRNRLLSSTTDLCFGADKINITHIKALIDDNHYTKLDHGLTSSDINPKDRQNYNSCIKLISDDVTNLLSNSEDTNGTVVYLNLLKMIVKAYIDKSTSISERIQSAWCVVFVCRLWWSWLKITSLSSSSKNKAARARTNNIDKHFISKPAYLSVELNAHNLLYLVLLVKQKHLPKQALVNIHLFSSQPCESVFRDARSLSGSFSTMVNFTVNNFIRRAQKLSILNEIKYNQSKNHLSFPVHHKHKQNDPLIYTDRLDEIDQLNVEQIILDAYDQAINIVKNSNMLEILNQNNITNLKNLSDFVFDCLRKSSKMYGYSSQTTIDNNEELESDDDGDDEDEDEESDEADELYDELLNSGDGFNDEEEILNSTRSNFDGIKIVDNINPALKDSYFKIKINDKIKYLHKQSACWLLYSNSTRLSSDRLSRVMQQTTNIDL
ncbi:unnamed protein product [Rotaria magnacalcarata]|uniref:Uncharacterized protein n=1 Tax=Rotaria magnacalcarata TaxID=392030 RepID=A0A816XJ21_9BILA|nr:unnamed protein product [Rotaria magnacalcarata]CAF4108849.1 unnamed protein product [Rotaria magnacalcarata]